MSEETKKKVKDSILWAGLGIFLCMFFLLVSLIFTDKKQTTINKTLAVVSYIALAIITGKKPEPQPEPKAPAEVTSAIEELPNE